MELKAFTLIELVLVIGILLILFTITIIAVNPAKQFAQTNNTKRQSDVNSILNATDQYIVDSHGRLPPGMSVTATAISKTGLDYCSLLIPTYIAALPVDPLTNNGIPVNNCASTYNTNYDIEVNSNNRITVLAPATELNVPTIEVTR